MKLPYVSAPAGPRNVATGGAQSAAAGAAHPVESETPSALPSRRDGGSARTEMGYAVPRDSSAEFCPFRATEIVWRPDPRAMPWAILCLPFRQNAIAAICPKGSNMSAQGNALGRRSSRAALALKGHNCLRQNPPWQKSARSLSLGNQTDRSGGERLAGVLGCTNDSRTERVA